MIGRLGVAAGTCVLAMAVPACGAAAAGPPPAREPISTVQEGDVSDAATTVDQWARERFPGNYAGIEIEDSRVEVYRTPSAAFDDGLRRLDLRAEAVPRDAPYSARELQALADRVTSDIGYWQGRGIEISSVGARQDGTAVEVGTPEPEKLGPLLAGRYGSAPPAVAVAVGRIEPAR